MVSHQYNISHFSQKWSKIDPVVIFITLLTIILVTIFIIPDKHKKLYEGLKRKLLISNTCLSQKTISCSRFRLRSDLNRFATMSGMCSRYFKHEDQKEAPQLGTATTVDPVSWKIIWNVDLQWHSREKNPWSTSELSETSDPYV